MVPIHKYFSEPRNYNPGTVDLKDPRIIEVEDTALEAVKEAEADSKSLDYMASFALQTYARVRGPQNLL